MASPVDENREQLEAVKAFFAPMSHAQVLKWCLNLNRHLYVNAPPLASAVVVVCLDTEGWDAHSEKVKEVGINTFDSRDVAKMPNPGPWGENILKNAYFYFARIQKNAHLRNKNFSAGTPESNRFGQMRFLDDEEIKHCLKDTFEWPLQFPSDGRVCPVVMLGHAVKGDVEKIRKLLNFDPYAGGNLVREIDTQVIARDVGHWNHRINEIGLQRLVNDMGFTYRDAHTASNDAAMTLIVAILLVLDRAWKGNSQPKTLQDVVDETEARSHSHDWYYGSATFCLRCAARDHMVNTGGRDGGPCRRKVHCVHCEKDRPGKEKGHRSEACVMKAYETSNSTRKRMQAQKGASAEKPADVAAEELAAAVPAAMGRTEESSSKNLFEVLTDVVE